MITEGVLNQINSIVDAIYSGKLGEVPHLFIGLMDEFDKLVVGMDQLGYSIDMSEELNSLSAAFECKDYIELSDILLDDVGEQLKGLAL